MNTLAVVAGLSKSGGGTSYSVPAWSNALAHEQVQRTLVTVLNPGEETSGFVDQKLVHLMNVGGFRVPLLSISWAPRLTKTLLRVCEETGVDLIHNHGIWLPANHSASVVSKKLNIPLVVTPHGMLTS